MADIVLSPVGSSEPVPKPTRALVAITLIAVAGFGAVVLNDALSRAGSGRAIRILNKRYARGQIDRDEYLTKLSDLGGSEPQN